MAPTAFASAQKPRLELCVDADSEMQVAVLRLKSAADIADNEIAVPTRFDDGCRPGNKLFVAHRSVPALAW
jgi:hypothetical protein